MDLKASIIEFMRQRPFLWNNKLPEYKDYKRREDEFQAFSEKIRCPVSEIKRVWHVLRTNFFRAHKMLVERKDTSHNGVGLPAPSVKLWKYYKAMEYVLATGSNGGGNAIEDGFTHSNKAAIDCGDMSALNYSSSRSSSNGTSSVSNQEDSGVDKDGRLTRSSKFIKDNRGIKREVRPRIQVTSSNTNNTMTKMNSATTAEIAVMDTNNVRTSRRRSHGNTGDRVSSLISQISSHEVSSRPDDNELYGRWVTSTLDRFDPTAVKLVKSKIDEIILDFMQQQKKDQELTSSNTATTTTSSSNNGVSMLSKKYDEANAASTNHPPPTN